MKLLFIGITPGSALKKVLAANQFVVETHKKLPTALSEKAPQLIAITPLKDEDLKQISELRKRYPKAWIAVVVPKSWLKSAELQNSLLACTEKNEVWIEEMWEATFWFSVQHMLRELRSQKAREDLIVENSKLKGNYTELEKSSDRLIEQLERDVALASNIQRSLLPKVSPEIPGISVAVKYFPSHGIGGDYYDLFEFGDKKRVGVLMADSKSHGLAATLLSVLLKVRLEEMKNRFPDSKSFIEHIHKEIQLVHREEMPPMSLLYGILDRASLTFQFTSAGHLAPVLWRQGAPVALAQTAHPPLGGVDTVSYRETMVSLRPGDFLLLHTDGLNGPLAMGGRNPLDELYRILKKKSPMPDALEVRNDLIALVDAYKEKQPLEDDLTLVEFSISERLMYLAQV